MKKIVWILTVFCFFLFLTTVGAQTAHAANLKFDKTSVSANVNGTFQIGVVVDSGSEEITSIDARILFDSGILEFQSASNGTFFPEVFDPIVKTGQVYIAGIVSDPAVSKTGTGTVTTITFKALKNGSTTLTYLCDTNESETSTVVKNDFDSTNIIVCSENGSATVTVGGAAANPTVTPAAAGGSSTPSQLPQSGVLDNIVKYAVPGMILLMVSGILKFLL